MKPKDIKGFLKYVHEFFKKYFKIYFFYSTLCEGTVSKIGTRHRNYDLYISDERIHTYDAFECG